MISRLLWWLFKRDRFQFDFDDGERTSTVVFYARTEKAAWRKYRAFVTSAIFGDWALTYEPHKVERVVKHTSLTHERFR